MLFLCDYITGFRWYNKKLMTRNIAKKPVKLPQAAENLS